MLIVGDAKDIFNKYLSIVYISYLCNNNENRADMLDFKSLVAKYLKEVANKIDTGTSEITESQAIDILRIVAHEVMSKEQACNYLNLSRSRFDDLVRENKLPRGKKRVGFKELVFYRDELDIAVRRMKDNK